MPYTIEHIAGVTAARVSGNGNLLLQVSQLVTDSRKIVFPAESLFFAVGGPRRNGHDFIPEVYDRGVRSFVVEDSFSGGDFPDAVFLHVPDVLKALQQLAAWHRSRFSLPVIGITGSNGKTIVKEWLYQLLRQDHRIVRSPRSYNSQLGVPLSVWQINETHTLGLFEAGISVPGEMDRLAAIIQPTIGVLTSLGAAHDEGFSGKTEKLVEKSKLFAGASAVIVNLDAVEDAGGSVIALRNTFTWSRKPGAALTITHEEKSASETRVDALYQSKTLQFRIPFTDRVSVNNALTCVCVLLQLGYSASAINERLQWLEPVDMRMQLKKGVNNCYLINDSYSNDTASLALALDYLAQQAGAHKTTLILSDILQSGQEEQSLYEQVARQLEARGISRLIGIGPAMVRYAPVLSGNRTQDVFFASTEDFFNRCTQQQFRDEYILLKGARVFAFERISAWLEQQVHQTVMEIDLSAMAQNLRTYRQQLRPGTKLMAMVKAFSYGSGSDEVARILQFHKVDYLAVAYADEGIALRKAGISLPIMVMNADEAGFDALVSYDLEPEIYSFGIYHAFHRYITRQGLNRFPVHIKFNTGMNRLGFEVSEAGKLAALLQEQDTMAVRSVFSHLVGSEAPEHDAFTAQQVAGFEAACGLLQEQLGYGFIRHISNTGGIFRHPDYQFDMVRLGIGLYGVDSAGQKDVHLETVVTVKTTIAQVRRVKKGDSVGYSRNGVVQRDSLIATVRIGYADGFSRKLGNGAGYLLVHGQPAPVVGNVCMDMTMIDVTDIPAAAEGDVVEVFGRNLPVQEVAARAGTIAYEILTGISQRVKRVYVAE